jgi:hypothetical protein
MPWEVHVTRMSSRSISHLPRSMFLLASCALGSAGGCTTAPGAVPPLATTQFDGDYAGDNTLTRGSGYPCGAPAYPQAMAVSAGRFSYPFVINAPVTAMVPVQLAADGTFNAQLQYGAPDFTPRGLMRIELLTITGQITGTALHATVTDYRCTRQLELARR